MMGCLRPESAIAACDQGATDENISKKTLAENRIDRTRVYLAKLILPEFMFYSLALNLERKARPGRLPVISPFSSTSSPLTSTYCTPVENWWGFAKLA